MLDPKPQQQNKPVMTTQPNPLQDFFSSTQRESTLVKEIQALKTSVRGLSAQLQQEKAERRTEIAQVRIQLSQLVKRETYQKVKTSDATINQSRHTISNPISKDLGDLDSIDRSFLKSEQKQTVLPGSQQSNAYSSLKQDLMELIHDYSQFRNDIKLEVAVLRDYLSDVELNVQQCMHAIGSKTNIKALVSVVTELQTKVGFVFSVSQRLTSDMESLSDQSEVLTSKVYKLQEKMPLELNRLQAVTALTKQEIQASQTQMNESITHRLSTTIESYNMNFEDMDRSINQMKQVMLDMVKINQLIRDKIGTRLSQTIDSQTFHRTIQGLSQNLHQTYLLNNQKIEDIHTKEYEVENEIHQMRGVIDYMQSDFGFNSRHKINDSMSSNESRDFGFKFDQNSTLISQMKIQSVRQIQDSKDNFVFVKKTRYRTQNNEYQLDTRKSSKRLSLADQLQALNSEC